MIFWDYFISKPNATSGYRIYKNLHRITDLEFDSTDDVITYIKSDSFKPVGFQYTMAAEGNEVFLSMLGWLTLSIVFFVGTGTLSSVLLPFVHVALSLEYLRQYVKDYTLLYMPGHPLQNLMSDLAKDCGDPFAYYSIRFIYVYQNMFYVYVYLILMAYSL